MNALVHAELSVEKYGGHINDYIHLHEKMDCSKAWIPNNTHRALTHHMFWVKEVMIPIFGSYITNSDKKNVSVKDICEDHILQDYQMKFIPTPQDFIQEIEFKEWMKNGNGICPSAQTMLYDKDENKVSPINILPFEPLPPLPPLFFDTDKMILDGGPNAPHNIRKNGGFNNTVFD